MSSMHMHAFSFFFYLFFFFSSFTTKDLGDTSEQNHLLSPVWELCV